MGLSKNWEKHHCELKPVEYKVVVLPDKVEHFADNSKLIEKPMDRIEKEQTAQVRGTLVAVGGMAFDGWEGVVPKPGQRVFYTQYAGIFTDIKGPTGVPYQIMTDKNICAVIEE